jgi:hypothetical protein
MSGNLAFLIAGCQKPVSLILFVSGIVCALSSAEAQQGKLMLAFAPPAVEDVAAASQTGTEDQSPISFQLDVQPVLTATGCNAGACHGKQRGQNGFQLSLLGFDADFDYGAIAKESRGRRIFPASAEQSLLLLKATGQIAHGGGIRFDIDSVYYQTLLNWIKQGSRRRVEQESQLAGIALNHNSRLLKPGETLALNVVATFTDGTTRDVTSLSNFLSNDSAIVAVDTTGKIIAGNLPGETAIMARYMNHIQVCQVAIPLTEPVDAQVFQALPRNNFVDDLVWQKLESLNIPPSPAIDDAKFMRRVYTDIIGRIPTADEARRFLDDKEPDKRARLVDELLEQPEYADFWANKWADLLRTNPYRVGIKTTLNYDNWIRQQFRENVPYDQFVSDLITAQGSTFRNGAVTMFRDRRSPDEVTTIVTQLFLGIRLECAKCHHHPFEKWSQEDFYSFAAYFAQVGRKGTGLSPPISGSEEIIFAAKKGAVTHPTTGETLTARTLFSLEATAESPGSDEIINAAANEHDLGLRDELAQWLTAPDNPYFAQVQVNRVWADLMGRGLVEPIDDLRATNPPSNEALLDALAIDFRDHQFDLKHLIRTICNSYVYSLSSNPQGQNFSDRVNYSRHYRHRLRAETLADSIAQLTGIEPRFDALPPGSLATQIWTHRTDSLFLDTFGRPNPNEDPPCERTRESTVTQSLHLMNARDIHRQFTNDAGNLAKLASSELPPAKILEEIYLMVYSRLPTANESKFAQTLIFGENETEPEASDEAIALKQRRVAIEDLVWSMINTPEFSIQD